MGMSWLLIVFLLLPNKLHSQSDITVFDFTVFDGKETNLIYQGDAYIPGGRITRLTSATEIMLPSRISIPYPLPNSVGRILYSPPIRLWDGAGRRQANFQTQIRGYIGNSWGIPLADGISFFIAPVNSVIPPGSTRGHMGLYDSSGRSPTPIFAVELDVSVNTWDPRYSHVGINVNSRASLSVARWPTTIGGVVEARISYDSRRRLVSVSANGTSAPLARLEHTVDLKSLLPEWVQIGISASTADPDAAQHEIRAWSFISFLVSDQDEDEPTYIRQY